jgi:hypothetical protein
MDADRLTSGLANSDLISLIDGDPLADIEALRRVRVVVAGGKAYDPAKLWRSVGFTP